MNENAKTFRDMAATAIVIIMALWACSKGVMYCGRSWGWIQPKPVATPAPAVAQTVYWFGPTNYLVERTTNGVLKATYQLGLREDGIVVWHQTK